MGTVETRAKTLAGGSGLLAETAKPRAKEEKPLKECVGSPAGPEGTRENGFPVSMNGEEVLGGGDVKVVETRVVETEVSVEEGFGGQYEDVSGVDEGGLEESELGGVSSLLKMRGSVGVREIEVKNCGESERVEKLGTLGVEGMAANGLGGGATSKNGVQKRRVLVEEFGDEEDGGSVSENGGDQDGKIEIIEVPIEDMCKNEDGEGEESVADEGYEFSVGDFVWGKIRSHPWWPGQVYDPSDASDFAAKLKVRGRLLVAYFGDGTFAWCQPSQLKPFEENFEEMSRQSNSKNFVYAVQRAVDEIGRLLELEMICSCVTKENGDGLDRPLAVNAGIRDAVLVPEGGIGKLSNSLSEPVGLLAEVKHVAQTITICSALGLRVLKSRLAAFYRAKGGYHLPIYHQPQPILGLEDNLNDDIVDIHNRVEVPIQGPFAEDWLASPVSPKFGQTSQTATHKSLEDLGDRLYQRRKKKSIAEIMEENIDGDVAKEGTISGKPAPLSSNKRKKGSDVTDDGHGVSEVLQGIKRKARILGSPLSTNSEVSGVESDGSGGKEETRKSRSSRVRKKDEGVSIEVDGGVGKEPTNDEPVTMKRKLNRSSLQKIDGNAKAQIEKGSFSRERRKSKYLSPPFTNLITGQKKKDMETESLKVSNESRMGERMRTAAGHLAGPSPILKSCNETFQKKLSEELGLEQDPSDISSPQTPKQDRILIIDPDKVKAASSIEVLSEVRRAAIGPVCPLGDKSLEMVGDFMSILRSSVYCDGSNYKAYNKRQRGRKRKNLESDPGSLGKDQSNTDHKSPGHESKQRTRKKTKEAESHETKPKKAAKTPDAKLAESHEAKPKKAKAAKTPDAKLDKHRSKQDGGTRGMKKSDKKTDGEASPVVLSVAFGPGSHLPSKADLIRIYGKFGALNEAETDMYYINFTARVAFVRSSDAEEALNHSLHASPFKAAGVTFSLLYPETKTRELREIPQQKASPPGKTPGKPSASQPSQLDFVRQKLETVNSMLENSGGKVSPEMKSQLEREIKGLLETVSTMVGSRS
ncbi:PWWP domain-containing protein 6-like [Corylus avellana]|uniref:PWWP domain-containing protein 6-like n=1 Tax=Corylus avellana TaxID=13451 RepID=UPI001E22F005|nr:PWWP domain-containing protein 6-like [Corylus avellana]